jgi:hypothetical protein
LPFPVLFFPAAVNSLMILASIWPKNGTLAKITELSLCCISLAVSLPASIALFDQNSVLTSDQLEHKF